MEGKGLVLQLAPAGAGDGIQNPFRIFAAGAAKGLLKTQPPLPQVLLRFASAAQPPAHISVQLSRADVGLPTAQQAIQAEIRMFHSLPVVFNCSEV